MAVKINLLPPSERQPRWPVNQLMAVGAIMIVTVLMGIVGFQKYTIWRLEHELAVAQQQYALLQATQKKMLLGNSKNQQAAAKTGLLLTLTAERKSWYTILNRLAVVTPPQIWLTELTGGDKGSLQIKGNALTYPDLVTFLQLLEQDELLTTPQLAKAEQDAKLAITRFELTVKIKAAQP
ncbi:MAG: Fimbrial assembly protein (PilN) [Firmicutes bacterium]|nr:Fimbrial assembly protein (PilN) [Bacillota bacterium]